jgi:hypothetical protein
VEGDREGAVVGARDGEVEGMSVGEVGGRMVGELEGVRLELLIMEPRWGSRMEGQRKKRRGRGMGQRMDRQWGHIIGQPATQSHFQHPCDRTQSSQSFESEACPVHTRHGIGLRRETEWHRTLSEGRGGEGSTQVGCRSLRIEWRRG